MIWSKKKTANYWINAARKREGLLPLVDSSFLLTFGCFEFSIPFKTQKLLHNIQPCLVFAKAELQYVRLMKNCRRSYVVEREDH